MAIYYARKSGNVNATDVWSTTAGGAAGDYFGSFTNQDTLMANSFTVTLNVNTTVLEIRNDTTGGATAGGGFTLNGGVTLAANIYAGSTNNCLTYSAASPNSSTILGNITGGTGTAQTGCVNQTGTGTLNITGNIIGGTGSTYPIGLRISSTGTCYITGNIMGGFAANAVGLWIEGNCTVIITGNVIGSANATANGVYVYVSATITIIGIVVGGNAGSPGLSINGAASIVTITRAKGNGFGPGSVGILSAVGLANAAQTAVAKVYEIEYGSLGQSPTSGPIELIGATSNVAVFATRFGSPKTLVDLNNAVNLVPSSGNVRSGTSYNYGNNVGTCVIPNSNSVVYGVPVDNVTGSGLLSPVAVWNALTSTIGTSGSIGERLKNCSTTATVGKQLEGVL